MRSLLRLDLLATKADLLAKSPRLFWEAIKPILFQRERGSEHAVRWLLTFLKQPDAIYCRILLLAKMFV
ncbi:hypothetical protein ABENE_14960 [Asticcacaulis benevestitus DSM 16100 = ATCC BAA-896]|uniref:Uncharacterized protein n=1 Tax=Asticcacaulis benevestitus DSM 16100 = ATCC BAA-896 TaxID=1121022 RepID=V4PKQ5_9CAUL|nr:hypothetical protein ABENE_14960 [Asticcacaulis benevestitus DSM 16100 = ATCC BAA-896]